MAPSLTLPLLLSRPVTPEVSRDTRTLVLREIFETEKSYAERLAQFSRVCVKKGEEKGAEERIKTENVEKNVFLPLSCRIL